MDYRSHYSRLIERARKRKLSGYVERHHVKPKCLGGSDSKRNLVELTPEEHYVAHQLLVKIYPGDKRLVWAAYQMTFATRNNPGRRNKCYGWLRRKLAKVLSETHKGRKFSEETKAKMRESAKRRWKENPVKFTKQHKERLATAAKDKPKSEAHRQALSRANLGKKYGNRPQEWKDNIRKGLKRASSKLTEALHRRYQSQEQRDKTSEASKKVWAKRKAGSPHLYKSPSKLLVGASC